MPIPVSTDLIQQVKEDLGLASADGLRRARVETAIRFYARCVGMDSPKDISSHVQGIDLSSPVEAIDLVAGTELAAYRFNPQRRIGRLDPFGLYFTDVGNSMYSLGINWDDRRFVRYVVDFRVPALRSRAKTGFVPGFGAVYGGAVQYVVPRASQHLRVVHIQNTQT